MGFMEERGYRVQVQYFTVNGSDYYSSKERKVSKTICILGGRSEHDESMRQWKQKQSSQVLENFHMVDASATLFEISSTMLRDNMANILLNFHTLRLKSITTVPGEPCPAVYKVMLKMVLDTRIIIVNRNGECPSEEEHAHLWKNYQILEGEHRLLQEALELEQQKLHDAQKRGKRLVKKLRDSRRHYRRLERLNNRKTFLIDA